MTYTHIQTVPKEALVGVSAVALVSSLLVPGRFGKILLAGTIIGVGYTFRSLAVQVDEFGIDIEFGGWYKARRIFMKDVLDCWTTRMNPVNGWGIHFTGEGWLYNVWGLNAVAVKLRDDTTIFIGSDEPGELVGAIKQHMEMRVAQ